MQEIWITRDKACDYMVLGWPSKPKCDGGEWYDTDFDPIILAGGLFEEITFENSPQKYFISKLPLDIYQHEISDTEHWPKDLGPIYPALGLTGEAGEVANEIKKVYRDNNEIFTEERIEKIKEEMGDVLWYMASLANILDFDLNDIAKISLDKVKNKKWEK